MNIICQACGQQAHRSGGGAKFCLPCGANRPRLAAVGRRRGVDVSQLRNERGAVCKDCAAVIEIPVGQRGPVRCAPCAKHRYYVLTAARSAASSAVANAVRRGTLMPARSYYCTDCPREAEQFDHRDYTRPLDVDPVCRSCNVMRGHADVWPEWVSRLLERGPTPLPTITAQA